MRMRELSQRSGVAVPTIKFYLREGLISPGEKSAPNAAAYQEAHLERLRLIALLRRTGRLGVSGVRRLLDSVDELGRWAPKRAREAALLLIRRYETVQVEASAQDQAPAPVEPLDLGDKAWLLARGIEEPARPSAALHDTVGRYRDALHARALQLDLADIEPLVAAAQTAARHQLQTADRVLRLRIPLARRLAMLLEILVLGHAITDQVGPAICRALAGRLLS